MTADMVRGGDRFRCCRGDLLGTLQLLDEEDDINKVLNFFSYEHFYVIYCKVPTSRILSPLPIACSHSGSL